MGAGTLVAFTRTDCSVEGSNCSCTNGGAARGTRSEDLSVSRRGASRVRDRSRSEDRASRQHRPGIVVGNQTAHSR